LNEAIGTGSANGVFPRTPPSQLTTDQSRETFRTYLRHVDKHILGREFEQARVLLGEARKLDPYNPFISAFQERIVTFEMNLVPQGPRAMERDQQTVVVPPASSLAVGQPVSQQQIERDLHERVEAEYKQRFTREVQKAEELAGEILREERIKLEQQKRQLEARLEQQLAEVRRQAESEYQRKLAEQMAESEERLERELSAERAFLENELRAQLKREHDVETRSLREKLQREQDELVARERREFHEHERAMQENVSRELQDALQKSENTHRRQTRQDQELERQKLHDQSGRELQEALAKERDAFKGRFNVLRDKLQQSFSQQTERLKHDTELQLQQQLKLLREQEMHEYEQRRKTLSQELEVEFRRRYEKQIAEERDRLRKEVAEEIREEKLRLQQEYDRSLKQQAERIKEVRAQMRREMEQTFLKRLEHVACQYDHKMELLGTPVPSNLDERITVYRDRMRVAYASGQPTVEGAKRIMELKELLGLTFDQHLVTESDVRLSLYVENVEKQIREGTLTDQDPRVLGSLKERFHISQEEARGLEPYLLSSFQKFAQTGRILFVDDDVLLLRSIGGLLVNAGYHVITAESVEKALNILQTTSFDLIISDIKFEGSDLDGFKFFTKVQAQPHLRSVPFVLMSSLKDGLVVRSGVKLGVDDYLTKPVDPDLLLSVVEGKIKRYRSMRT